jgi:hypothetical protein
MVAFLFVVLSTVRRLNGIAAQESRNDTGLTLRLSWVLLFLINACTIKLVHRDRNEKSVPSHYFDLEKGSKFLTRVAEVQPWMPLLS